MSAFLTTASLITSIVSLGLGIFVYLKNSKSPVNRTWMAFSCSVSIWSFGIFALHNSPDEVHASFWVHFMYVGSILTPSFFLHFIFSITGKGHSLRDKRSLISSFKYFTDPGIFFPLFVLFLLITIIYAHYVLVKTLQHSSGAKRNQLRYIFAASLVGFGGGIITFLPFLNIKIFPFGHFLVLFYPIIISFAIVKHHLMDITIVIKKSTVYTILAFLSLIPCTIVIVITQRYLLKSSSPYFIFLVFCTLLLSSLIFVQMKTEIEEYVEKRLFKDKYEYKKALAELSEVVISFLDEKELFKKAGTILTKDLGTEKVSFFMLDREKRAYTLRASQKLVKPKIRTLPENDIFFQWFQTKGKAVVKEEIEKIVNDPKIKPVIKTMDSMDSEVCIPLMTRRSELIGIVNLGHKRSGAMYSHEDLDLLTQFAAQASIALENARLYREMQQTQTLLRRTDRLSSLGSLTANLAHEIRNPLATIRTFLDLFPQRYRDKEFRGEFLKLTSSELDRISTLVTQLLSFARPAKPDVKKGDINQVLEDIIQLVTVEAKKRHVTIDTNLQEIHQALLDADQMKQVFLNIFLNAFEAIKNRGRISVTSRDIKKNGMAYVQVEISDSGQGIPEKILEHIFDPFFTTKKKGGGLGLSISHQIVQEHNGFIEVESRAKKGTTFTITIPCET
jgi:signal transduction histidine kinase